MKTENKNLETSLDLSFDELEISLDFDENIENTDVESIVEKPVISTLSLYHEEFKGAKLDERSDEIDPYITDLDSLRTQEKDILKKLNDIQIAVNPKYRDPAPQNEIIEHFKWLSEKHPDLYDKSININTEYQEILESIKDTKTEIRHINDSYDEYDLGLELSNITDCVEVYSLLENNEFDISSSMEQIDKEISEMIEAEAEKIENSSIKEQIKTYGTLLLNCVKKGNLKEYHSAMDKLLS